MRIFLVTLCYILCATFANAQVRPDNFTPRTEIDSSNTEFYSQKDGVSRRINVFDVRRYTLLDIIDGYQATPTDTGNTDIGRLVKDTLGQKYIIDGDGESELVYDSLQWQSLSFSNDTIYISGVSTGVYLGALAGAGTDDQVLSISNDTLSIEDGNSVVLPTSTALADTITILAYGNSYIINNSDTTSTGAASLAYKLNQNIYAYDYRRDSIGVLVEDTTLWGGSPLNAPPQIIGGGDGLGIDRFPRNTTWQNHFAHTIAENNPNEKVFMLTAGKGGVGSDSLLYSFYWDSLQAYVTEAIAANPVYSHYDYVFLSLGPLEDAPSLESSLLNYRDSLFAMGVIDDRTQFVVKEQPADAITNIDWYQVLPYLDNRYDWVSAVYGVKDSTTNDGVHPTPYQLKVIGEKAYKVLTGTSQTSLIVDDQGNVSLGKSSLYGLANTYRNFFSNPYTFDPTAIDSIVNTFYWNPDSVLFSGYYRNFYNIGSNFSGMSGFTDAQNILFYGWDNFSGAGTLRDSVMVFGYGNGNATTRAFNVIGGKYNNPGHANVDYVMSANQTSSATGDKFLFAGVNAINMILGDSSWVFNLADTPGDNEVLTFDSGSGTASWEASAAGTDDQTFAEVLTQGNTANLAIDMNGNNLNNVGNLTVDATTNDFVLDGNGTDLEVTVAATERFSISQTGVVQINNAFAFPTADGTSGQVLKTDGAGSLTWQDESGVASTSSYGEYTIDDNDPDTLSITAGTYELLTDVTIGDTLNFKLESNRLIYTGAESFVAQVVANTSFTYSVNNTVIEFSLFLNGVELTGIQGRRKIATGADLGETALTGLVSLSQNDTLDVRFDADNTGDIIIQNLNLNVASIGGASAAAGGGGGGSQEYDFAAADTSTTALTSSTWNTVTWDTEIIEDASFTHTAGSADILFDSIGTYIITATLITNYASRNDAWVGINIDTGSGYPATPVLISQLPIHFSTPAGFNQMGMTLTYIHVATDTNDKARCSIYPSAASFSYGKSQLRIQRID